MEVAHSTVKLPSALPGQNLWIHKLNRVVDHQLLVDINENFNRGDDFDFEIHNAIVSQAGYPYKTLGT